MRKIEVPLANLTTLERKARVEALLDRYLEGVDFQGALQHSKCIFKDITPES